jgi:hypothetical protein
MRQENNTKTAQRSKAIQSENRSSKTHTKSQRQGKTKTIHSRIMQDVQRTEERTRQQMPRQDKTKQKDKKQDATTRQDKKKRQRPKTKKKRKKEEEKKKTKASQHLNKRFMQASHSCGVLPTCTLRCEALSYLCQPDTARKTKYKPRQSKARQD